MENKSGIEINTCDFCGHHKLVIQQKSGTYIKGCIVPLRICKSCAVKFWLTLWEAEYPEKE